MRLASEKLESFRVGVRWLQGQRISVSRHCEERQHRKVVVNQVCRKPERNERRGNLPALTETREPFNIVNKNSLPQTQCDEIASGMIQRLAKLIFTSPLSMPRNDEGWWRLRVLQSFQSEKRIEIVL